MAATDDEECQGVLDHIDYHQALKCLINESLSMLKFSEAINNAKKKSPQSYVYHTVSVGTLSLGICEEIVKDIENGGKDAIEVLKDIYKTDYRRLCYYSGFFHDWTKLYSEEEKGFFKISAEAKQKAKELAKQTKIPNSDFLIDHIANFAEGHLPNNVEASLWASVKVADMLMISDIYSVSDVFKHAESLNYREAIKVLNAYNLYLSYIKSSPRLFTLLISENIIRKIEGKSLISYRDGIVYLSRGKKPVSLASIYDIYYETLHASAEIDSYVEEIKRCINNKREEWESLNLGKFKEVIYDEEGKGRQVNALLPSAICNYFEDIVIRLSPLDKIKVAEKLIEQLGDEIPYGIIAYFVEKFSRKKKDEDYVKKYLGIRDKFPLYLEQINDVKVYLEKIIKALQERYGTSAGEDYTLKAFVKKNFSGDIVDDLSAIDVKPKNYCTVCGMPIYGSATSFVLYSDLLGGKAEIWIPREKGLEKIDSIRDDWAVCPICHYEAEQMKGQFVPPYIIVSFYPGIPTDLLSLLRFDYSLIDSNQVYADVKEDKSFLEVYSKSGGYIEPKSVAGKGSKISLISEIKPDYLGSKVVIPIQKVMPTEKMLSTRLTKNELNHILYYAPFISISYLASPLFISSNIYDFPLATRNIEIFSDINYSWIKIDEKRAENYVKILLLLAYSAKYNALKNTFKRKDDMENNLNSMVNDMDLFSSVDKSLGIIATGMAVEEKVFFTRIKPFVRFLNFALEEVGSMGETFSRSLTSLTKILKEATKDEKPSKHDVVGFLRDGIDMFFKSSLLEKDDRINIASSSALNTLTTKYSLNDAQMKIAFSKLKDIFSQLYDVEEKSDRSLAISISTALVNWLYVLYLYYKESASGEENE